MSNLRRRSTYCWTSGCGVGRAARELPMTPTNTAEPRVAAPARGGGPPAVDVRSVHAVVRGVVARVLGSDDPEFEDVLQSSFERVWTTASAVTSRRESLAHWAAAVARNVAVDVLRARSRERKVLSRGEDAADPPAGVDPEGVASAREGLARFASGLRRLREGVARVVFMHDVLGCDLVEVAAALEITVAAAQSGLVRGRQRILPSPQVRLSQAS